MTVKRWSVGVDGPDENGNLVTYSDYLSLAAENSSLRLTIDNIVKALGLGDGQVSQQVIELVNGLVAENVAMKEWSPDPRSASMFEAIEKVEQLMGEGMPELAMVEAFEILKLKRTPATDAAIAEIKAQGVDEFVIYATAPSFSDHDLTVEDAEEFAATLRAGGNG